MVPLGFIVINRSAEAMLDGDYYYKYIAPLELYRYVVFIVINISLRWSLIVMCFLSL